MLKKRFLQIIKGLAIAIILVIVIYLLFLFVETFLLPIYVFILLLVVAIFVWVKNPALKAKRLIPFVSVAAVLILGWRIWQFRTYDPEEKIYSIDKQYSFYLAKYNYNKIAKYHPFFFFDGASYDYKAFVYDEIEQKMLASGYVGDIKWNHSFGFDYDDYFCFTRDFRYWFSRGNYKLPRPIIDIKTVEEQSRMRGRAISDSIRLAREDEKAIRQEEIRQEIEEKKKEFADSRLILQREISDMQPIIKKWIDFHNIDLTQARLIKQVKFYFDRPDEPHEKYPYYREYTSEDDRDDRIEMFYSPNGQRYLDLGIRYKTVEGKKYMDSEAYDTTQQGYLTDRQEKQNKLLFNVGNSGHVEVVFWQNDDMFILVGYWYDDAYNWYSIDVYDIKNNFINHYRVPMDTVEKNYHYEIVMEEKGIIPFR